MATQTCPRCRLISDASAQVCDCGYDFATRAMRARGSIEKRPPRAVRIVVGATLLLIATVNGANNKTMPRDVAGALGGLTGLLILVVAAVWLIASGLPRSIAAGTELQKVRRRLWLQLVAIGFVAMIGLAAVFAALSWFAAAVIVTWLYWFGWTWLAWLIADRNAARRLQFEGPHQQPK